MFSGVPISLIVHDLNPYFSVHVNRCVGMRFCSGNKASRVSKMSLNVVTSQLYTRNAKRKENKIIAVSFRSKCPRFEEEDDDGVRARAPAKWFSLRQHQRQKRLQTPKLKQKRSNTCDLRAARSSRGCNSHFCISATPTRRQSPRR